MLKSMTAYGRDTVISLLGNFTVEIQSVNRKHLEIHTSLPSEFFRFDADIKKEISSVVGRGQVNVKVNVTFEKLSPLIVIPNTALAKQVQNAWQELAQKLELTIDHQMIANILSRTENLLIYSNEIENEAEYKDILLQTIKKALIHLVDMKIYEGKALHKDISTRLTLLSHLIKSIAEKSPLAVQRYQEKLKERLEEMLGSSIENEERLLREICIYADKIDITEEITRFNSHLEQMHNLLNSDQQAIGKTLEFLIQELNREINTIGSKSSDVDVSRFVIECKTELERIREQIQNIE